VTSSWAVTTPALVAQYMNHAEADCNTEFAEIFLADFLWTACEKKAIDPQVSAAFSAKQPLWHLPKSRY